MTFKIFSPKMFCPAQASLDHIMRIQALELGKYQIRVNTVRPTVVLTPLVAAAWDKDKLAEMESVCPRPCRVPVPFRSCLG